ncbi:MAG: phosphoglucosamine mutase, partial [Candidatus Izemoplasmatales bacterium]
SLSNNTFGIMVTASHNPYTDNGIKVFDKGNKLKAQDEAFIESVIDGETIIKKAEISGQEKEFKNAFKKYLNLYDGLIEKVDLKIALDLANGAATTTAEKIFSKLSKNICVIANEPDGYNINKDCGSTHLGQLQDLVIKEECDLGIAFDGDADRLMVVDHQGQVCDGDFLIYLFASYLKAHKQLKNKFVALSKMCNIGIIKALNEKDIEVIQTDVGDKYITQAIEEHDGVLGGENSGHIINKLLFETGDGVLNAAFLIKVLQYYKLPLALLKEQVQYYPDKLINLKNIDKTLASHPQVVDIVNKHLCKLAGDGKILVRPSGTEPLIRISASAPSELQVDLIIEEIKSKIEDLAKEGN